MPAFSLRGVGALVAPQVPDGRSRLSAVLRIGVESHARDSVSARELAGSRRERVAVTQIRADVGKKEALVAGPAEAVVDRAVTAAQRLDRVIENGAVHDVLGVERIHSGGAGA